MRATPTAKVERSSSLYMRSSRFMALCCWKFATPSLKDAHRLYRRSLNWLYAHVVSRPKAFCPFNVIRKRNLSVAKTRESTIPLGGVQKLTHDWTKAKTFNRTREQREYLRLSVVRRSKNCALVYAVSLARVCAVCAACDNGLDLRILNWLILPVSICLFQRLSHACLSTVREAIPGRNRRRLIKSVVV